jgi:hypothetical protein
VTRTPAPKVATRREDLKHGHWYEVAGHPNFSERNVIQYDAYEPDPHHPVVLRVRRDCFGKMTVQLDVFPLSRVLHHLVEVPVPADLSPLRRQRAIRPDETEAEGRARAAKIRAERPVLPPAPRYRSGYDMDRLGFTVSFGKGEK